MLHLITYKIDFQYICVYISFCNLELVNHSFVLKHFVMFNVIKNLFSYRSIAVNFCTNLFRQNRCSAKALKGFDNMLTVAIGHSINVS